MSHYRSDLRDVEFNLFEVLRIQDHLGSPPFGGFDDATAREVLHGVADLAAGPFAASFTVADREPPRLVDGAVILPAPMRDTLDAYFAGDWHLLQLPEHLGGYGAPPTLVWAATSMLLGANPAAVFYTAGPVFARILDRLVTEEQRRRWVLPMIQGRWGASMVLTEPDAGSDVGAATTRAHEAGDGIWHLSGVKRFITNGDFDWPDNIIHLVLARPEGARPGVKGLSMFLVPKYWVEEDGTIGARNGVTVAKLEDKLGMKASATCELLFGDGAPARGVLVGDVHDGIRQMFQVIVYARMLVATKAIETLSTGYRNALAYARERLQGPDLAAAGDPDAPRVPIIGHPDVRRMLLDQKAHVEALRALVLYTASLQDRVAIAEASGGRDHQAERRTNLLLPLIKGHGAERAYELLATSLQVLGGSGYLRDHPIEQYLRDAKLDSLYEGTTGIQSLDLVFRQVARDQGATLNGLLDEIAAFAKAGGPDDRLAPERLLLAAAVDDIRAMVSAMAGLLRVSVHVLGLTTTPFLHALAEVVCAWLSLRHATVALDALGNPASQDTDRAFYQGKIVAARWYTHTVLPHVTARRRTVDAPATAVIELDDQGW